MKDLGRASARCNTFNVRQFAEIFFFFEVKQALAVINSDDRDTWLQSVWHCMQVSAQPALTCGTNGASNLPNMIRSIKPGVWNSFATAA